MRSFSSILLLFLFVSCQYSQNPKPRTDKLQFPVTDHAALQQLSQYPLPRYLPGNTLSRLFNWMDPYFMGGAGQASIDNQTALKNASFIQEELALHWNYGLVVTGANGVFNYLVGDSCPLILRLANAHPEIPLHVITNWMSSSPHDAGFEGTVPMIMRKDLNPSLYVSFNIYGNQGKEIKFNFPDSLIRRDGEVQKYYLKRILHCLNRPIDLINDNGEEPPGPYLLDFLKKDPEMKRMKDSMRIDSWEDFMALRKLAFRVTYASAFMQGLPELKKTLFSFYIVEGGPVDRFRWPILKKCMSPRNGIYYSTPDFYPRWPSNWKDWKGPWHGWKWIETGRKTEIRDGDYLFSPFVAAGWSSNPSDDIRPGQWLGLLKCLAVAGAEFYYVGYFNLSSPFTNPSLYTWQAAMPAYAQAVTSRYEDVLREGNVLFDKEGEPILSYPVADPHVLITARKHKQKEKYVICGTYQPFSNDSGEIPEKRIVTVRIDKQEFTFEVRRQGSVYIYEKLGDGKIVFYQLDPWHENAHPERWSPVFCFEAETPDSPVDPENLTTSNTGGIRDYSCFTTSLHLNGHKTYEYHFTPRKKNTNTAYVWIRYKGKGLLNLSLQAGSNAWTQQVSLPSSPDWTWYKLTLPSNAPFPGENILKLSSGDNTLDLDKLVVTEKSASGSFPN